MNCHFDRPQKSPAASKIFQPPAAQHKATFTQFLSYQSHKSPQRRHLWPISGGGTHFTPFLLFVVTQLSLIRIGATKIARGLRENAPSGDTGSAPGEIAGVVALLNPLVTPN